MNVIKDLLNFGKVTPIWINRADKPMMDGVAQIKQRGKVSVFPFESHRSIGKVHGNIETEHPGDKEAQS